MALDISTNSSVINKARVITILGPSGGSGKTTITANFAYELAAAGKKVIIVDADYATGGASLLVIGSLPKVTAPEIVGNPLSCTWDLIFKSADSELKEYTAVDAVLLRKKELKVSGKLHLLLNSTTFWKEMGDNWRDEDYNIPRALEGAAHIYHAFQKTMQSYMTRFRSLVHLLRQSYDYVLLDTRGGFDAISAVAAAVADVALLVGTEDSMGQFKIETLLQTLARFNKDVLKCDSKKPGIILNQVDPKKLDQYSGAETRIGDAQVIAALPFSLGVREAYWRNDIVFKSAPNDPFVGKVLLLFTTLFPELSTDKLQPTQNIRSTLESREAKIHAVDLIALGLLYFALACVILLGVAAMFGWGQVIPPLMSSVLTALALTFGASQLSGVLQHYWGNSAWFDSHDPTSAAQPWKRVPLRLYLALMAALLGVPLAVLVGSRVAPLMQERLVFQLRSEVGAPDGTGPEGLIALFKETKVTLVKAQADLSAAKAQAETKAEGLQSQLDELQKAVSAASLKPVSSSTEAIKAITGLGSQRLGYEDDIRRIALALGLPGANATAVLEEAKRLAKQATDNNANWIKLATVLSSEGTNVPANSDSILTGISRLKNQLDACNKLESVPELRRWYSTLNVTAFFTEIPPESTSLWQPGKHLPVTSLADLLRQSATAYKDGALTFRSHDQALALLRLEGMDKTNPGLYRVLVNSFDEQSGLILWSSLAKEIDRFKAPEDLAAAQSGIFQMVRLAASAFPVKGREKNEAEAAEFFRLATQIRRTLEAGDFATTLQYLP